ncbi:MAG: hypothetical protein NT062_27675 [Proteobacteria bacterium]|nr:hypothetical protein [Pseudomonadota bacterium]
MRSRAVLGVLVVLSGFRTSSATPCAPRAKLDGDAPVVAKVAVELRRLGVETPTTTDLSCPAIEATVVRDDAGIAVAIRDRVHRREGRVVTDASVAAAWIDSWLHDDNEAPLPAPPESPSTVIPLAPPQDTVPTIPAHTPTLLDRLTLAATYERSYGDDGLSASGGSVAACVHVGSVCVGGRVRGAFVARRPVDQAVTSNVTPMIARSDLSALAIANVSLHVGQTIVSPELGLGVGRLATEHSGQCTTAPPVPGCDVTDPTCTDPSPPPPACGPNGALLPPTTTTTSWTPRATAAMRIAIPLFEHVWLDGMATVALAPFGPRAATMADGMIAPADPFATLQLGVGLRVGMP